MDCAIAQAVSHRLLTAEAWFPAKVSPYVGFAVGKVALGQVFPGVLLSFPCQYHSITAPYSLMHHLGDGQRAR